MQFSLEFQKFLVFSLVWSFSSLKKNWTKSKIMNLLYIYSYSRCSSPPQQTDTHTQSSHLTQRLLLKPSSILNQWTILLKPLNHWLFFSLPYRICWSTVANPSLPFQIGWLVISLTLSFWGFQGIMDLRFLGLWSMVLLFVEGFCVSGLSFGIVILGKTGTNLTASFCAKQYRSLADAEFWA